MANVVALSPEYFPNPSIGRPLSQADIYVGTIDLDPKIPANQKTLSVLQEDGSIVTVTQPISTGAGGVPLYNGSPVSLLVDGSYSLRVDDKTGSQVYYVPKNSEDAESYTSINSIAALRSITYIPNSNDNVVVLGYYVPGDGGGQPVYWDSTSTEADNGFTIFKVTSIATGRFKSVSTENLNIKQAGAKGDGITVDDTARDIAIASGYDIFYPPGTYRYSTQTNINVSAKHYGRNYLSTKILLDDGLNVLVTAINVTLEGLNFSADDNSVDVHMVRVEQGASNFIMNKCRIGDTSTAAATSTQNGLRIDAQDVDNFQIKDTLFENISCMGDLTDIPVVNGFASGIIFLGSEAAEVDYDAPSKGKISHCRFINIYTEKNPANPGDVDYDADAIKVVIAGGITPDTDVQWGLDIDNCYFRSVQKSAVKCGGMTNLNISNCTIISDRTDIDMIAGIRVQWGSNVTISNTVCSGNFTYLLNLYGQNITVRNTSYNPGDGGEVTSYCVLLQTETAFENNNIVVSGLSASSCAGAISLTDTASVGSTGTKMTFENFTISKLLASSSSNPVLDIKFCDNTNINNINIYDNNSNAHTCLYMEDYTDLTVSDCHLEALTYIINQNDNSVDYPNLTLKDLTCKWTASGNVSAPMINLVAAAGTVQVLAGITIENLKLIARTTSARVSNGIKIKAIDFSIDGVVVYSPDLLTVTSAAFVEAIGIIDSSKGIVSGVRYNSDTLVASAGTSWAVNIEDSVGITVTDVVSDNSGVVLRGTTDSTLVNGVNASTAKDSTSDLSSGTNTIANEWTLVTP